MRVLIVEHFNIGIIIKLLYKKFNSLFGEQDRPCSSGLLRIIQLEHMKESAKMQKEFQIILELELHDDPVGWTQKGQGYQHCFHISARTLLALIDQIACHVPRPLSNKRILFHAVGSYSATYTT